MPALPADLTLLQLGVLCAAALCAGVVDAIAGGGGLVTLPALLGVGLPPHLAMGTNKGQSVFGSGAALWRFARAGLVDFRLARVTFPLGLVGSFLGTQLVLVLSPAVLRPLVMVLLVAVAAYLAFRQAPHAHAHPELPWERARLAGACIAAGVGAYDGFFGPGTGTFLIVLFNGVLGHTLQRASADAKVVNFASNIASVAAFALSGKVLWAVALPMAACQFVGATVGVHLAVKGGSRLVRVVVLCVVVALVTKLGFDAWRG